MIAILEAARAGAAAARILGWQTSLPAWPRAPWF